ncbi:MAG: hypothetical protein V6Z81_06225 [Parvularculales bacterium]
MRDEALVHFHYGRLISAGVHFGSRGMDTPQLLSEAAPWLDPRDPGKCVVGLCCAHAGLIENICNAPPASWQSWMFRQWDDWFGRINGVFLLDLETLRLIQHPMYRCDGTIVPCDLSAMPRRLQALDSIENDLRPVNQDTISP